MKELIPAKLKIVPEEKKVEEKEPEVNLKRISRDQKIEFGFNEDMVVPKFASSKRML